MNKHSRNKSTSSFQKSQAASSVLPLPEVYEAEYHYWPWGELIASAIEWVRLHAAPSSAIVDYMCGTGFLLDRISKHRHDLHLSGCSLTPEYIVYANRNYPHLRIELQNALTYKPERPPDVIICTAGLHHLERDDQSKFIGKVAGELAVGKYFLLGEEVIRPYATELDRRFAVLELWANLMSYVLKKAPPVEVMEAATDALVNDLYERGEYKLTFNEVNDMLFPHFLVESVIQTWPGCSKLLGDFLFICRRQ